MLTDRITLLDEGEEPEDYLGSALGVIFPDDIVNQHGDPTTTIIYNPPPLLFPSKQSNDTPTITTSSTNGASNSQHRPRNPLILTLCTPATDSSRRLFSHHLWNSSVQLAALIEDGEALVSVPTTYKNTRTPHFASATSPTDRSTSIPGDSDLTTETSSRSEKMNEEKEATTMPQRISFEISPKTTVLELGAGTGLAALVAHLTGGAGETVVTDYPAPEILQNITANVRRNVKGWVEEKNPSVVAEGGDHETASVGRISVQGHAWGVLDPEKDSFVREKKHGFERVLVADCLWMPWEHEALARSLEWFLGGPGEGREGKEGGRAWVVAGFHTGREKVARFFSGVSEGWGDEEEERDEQEEEEEEDDDDDNDDDGGNNGGNDKKKNNHANHEEEKTPPSRKEQPKKKRPSGLVIEHIWERNAEGEDRAWVADRGREDITGRKRWLVIAVLRRRRVGEE